MSNNFKTKSIFNLEFDNIAASELVRKVINHNFTVIGVTDDDVESVIGFSNERDMDLAINQAFNAVDHLGADFKEIKIIRNSTGVMIIYTNDEK